MSFNPTALEEAIYAGLNQMPEIQISGISRTPTRWQSVPYMVLIKVKGTLSDCPKDDILKQLAEDSIVGEPSAQGSCFLTYTRYLGSKESPYVEWVQIQFPAERPETDAQSIDRTVN